MQALDVLPPAVDALDDGRKSFLKIGHELFRRLGYGSKFDGSSEESVSKLTS